MEFDIAIFGGGVVGCNIFSLLTRVGKKAVLIEKENDVSLGCSKANSGIVHAGYDCEENSLKARLNVRGCFLMENLCKELSVPYTKCGSFVVGNDLEKLETLYNRGIKNGVKNLEIIKDNLISFIPNINNNIKYALYAKDAGIVNPYMLTIALAEDGVLNGGKIEFNFSADKIYKENNLFIISNGSKTIKAKYIINASGYGYNEIANLLGSENYNLSFRRGEYFVLDKGTGFVNAPIFPLPTDKGKGILATPTNSGNILFGPTADDDEVYCAKTTSAGLSQIKSQITNTFNNIPFNKIIRQFSGVRVSAGKDFIIEKSKKVENVINICGINSPGLTSAPAIAEYVLSLLDIENRQKENIVKRIPYRIKEDDRANLIKKDSRYGKIICRCEVVSEMEIINAINSPLKPKTLDGIKRRVRCGMGRCQGGFCTNKIIELIAKENGLQLEDIEKEFKASNLMIADIKSTEFYENNEFRGKNE